mgnify:CR=1 FL=1
MEGKAVLFKKFAGIDVLRHRDRRARSRQAGRDHRRARAHASAASTSRTSRRRSASYIERKLRERMKIPVFHDDQHGTAIIVGAAVLNGLQAWSARTSTKVKLVVSGAGAAALACLRPAGEPGHAARRTSAVTDIKGVVYKGRTEEMDAEQGALRARDEARTLADVDRRAPTCSSACRPAACSKPEMVQEDGRAAADPRARQPRAGDPAEAGEGERARRGDRHRALGLSRTR